VSQSWVLTGQEETGDCDRLGSGVWKSVNAQTVSLNQGYTQFFTHAGKVIVTRRPHMYRTASTGTHRSGRSRDVGFGGFPAPHEILAKLFRKAFPQVQLRLSRTLTMPRTTTMLSQTGSNGSGAHVTPYLTFPAVVGRNSAFQLLTKEHLEELGGVEYRALNMLLWIVGCVRSSSLPAGWRPLTTYSTILAYNSLGSL
jgi:hypothetical protein